MPREIKSVATTINPFSGTVTLYTVPTGRQAKVTLSAFSASFNLEFFVAGISIFSSIGSSSSSAAANAVTDPVSPGHEQMVITVNGNGIRIIPRVFYIGAGMTVQAQVGNTPGTCIINLGIIEEF